MDPLQPADTTATDTAAAAATPPASAPDLWPPRERASRQLWDQMCKFRKQAKWARRGEPVAEMVLPAHTSYLRACVHAYAKRLEMDSFKNVSNPQTVLLKVRPLTADATGNGGAGPSKRPRKEAATNAAEPAAAAVPAPPVAAVNLKAKTSELHVFAKEKDCVGALRHFEAMVADGTPVLARHLSILISLCALEEDKSYPNIRHFASIRALFEHSQKSGLFEGQGKHEKAKGEIESAFSGMIKLHCISGDALAAEEKIRLMERMGIPARLRTISPLIGLAERRGDLQLAERAQALLRAHKIDPATEELLSLGRLYASADAAAFRGLLDWMAELLRDSHHASHAKMGLSSEQLDLLAGAFELANESARAEGGQSGWRTSRVTIDAAGASSVGGVRLRPIALANSEREALCAGIQQLIPRTFAADFSRFTDYVSKRGPWDYVVDGANVGFFGQGAAIAANRKARQTLNGGVESAEDMRSLREARQTLFSVDRLEAMLQTLTDRGSKTLLVLHVQHMKRLQQGEASAALLERWQSEGVLYFTPHGHNDDWYWLYAAVASGARCYAISNDEMRDHHFVLLHNKSFLRWKERHVVHFNYRTQRIAGAVGVVRDAGLLPLLEPPQPYSPLMQMDPVSGAWHVPSIDAEEWICAEPVMLRGERDEQQQEARAAGGGA